ncbi:hypothetical protein PUNSTDRAFT_64274 [Punctularia strigosozonata HHB-11173 SS5]|uniref:uncharacterized protein n=1 Tax=Punctularia strigosozonata (strain HHB-11173) TaxID=741275 RepID=UPI0004418691|nr:uncharacterized protein PUNSTDRAFT_64274 [Punctularia strigosozonata HHB-11173 SS5]EIN10387.1 hypothetical protein PUNSTDRAFT_64274 [Punctularia strigosozonata HHB-11173 SS5]
MATSNDAAEAWEAYQSVVHLSSRVPFSSTEGASAEEGTAVDHNHSQTAIPFAHLHRLARLLASTHPRTREVFLRLLSVMNAIRRQGGRLRVWEWNALIDFAGKGWRRTRPDDFKRSLDVFEEMITYNERLEESARADDPDEPNPYNWDDLGVRSHLPTAEPDIVTYSTLLNVASRVRDPDPMRLATSLLKSSGLVPNRITLLILLSHASRKGDLLGIRNILAEMRDHDLALGLDGINACLWGFARCGRPDIAAAIYRVLRHNCVPELGPDGQEVAEIQKRLEDEDYVPIPGGMVPDEVTYTAWVQIQCYRGDLVAALEIFTEMLETTRPSYSSGNKAKGNEHPNTFPPTLAIFRALFIGFAKHAEPPARTQFTLKSGSLSFQRDRTRAWTVDKLHVIFQAFLTLPADVKPSSRTIYNVLMAYSKASGHDVHRLRRVWAQLADRFGGHWGGRLEKFRKQLHSQKT